jgi:hypothetical protein
MSGLRLLEELFPFAFYHRRKHQKESSLDQTDFAHLGGPYERYFLLTDQDLLQRISEERQRATTLDEKTFKFTIAFTLGLAILGSSAFLNIPQIEPAVLKMALKATFGLAVIYLVFAGFLALGAIRVSMSFGYGTDFVIRNKESRSVLVRALASQEVANIIRQLRNETAYQCLRNAGILVAAGTLLYLLARHMPIDSINL